jgi:hypothetical protein
MKRLLSSRLIAAFLAGALAGVFVWQLPQAPRAVVQIAFLQGRGQILQRITSNGRFAILQTKADEPDKHLAQVWDLEGDLSKPLISTPISDGGDTAYHLSADETKLLLCDTSAVPLQLQVYDLQSGQRTNEYAVERADRNFFAPDGKLLDYSGENLIDLATGKAVGRSHVPEDLDKPTSLRCEGKFFIRQEGRQWKCYSALTGELVSEISTPADDWLAGIISDDGMVWNCFPQNMLPSGGKSVPDFQLIDCRTGISRTKDELGFTFDGLISPDGRIVCGAYSLETNPWIEYFAKLIRGDAGAPVRLIRWADNAEVGFYQGGRDTRFSPRGNLLAIVRRNGVFELRDFPIATPWFSIVGAALIVASCTWAAVWLWSRCANARRQQSA